MKKVNNRTFGGVKSAEVLSVFFAVLCLFVKKVCF